MAKKNINISGTELKTLLDAIRQTWGAIASDVCDSGEPDNEQAIECCVDADRLEMYGGDKVQRAEATKILRRLIDETDYLVVLKFLSKKIRLV